MNTMPKTERNIYRLGYPIPFPTSYDEAVRLLDWAVGELHEQWHLPNNGPDSCATLVDTHSDWCRMRLALSDPRFRCEDAWHLVYHGGGSDEPSGVCPTCGQHWIATTQPK